MQEYWSRLPFPTPGDLPNPGIKLHLLPWQVDSLPLSHQGSPYTWHDAAKKKVTSVIFLFKSYNPCLIIGETETNYNWGAFDRIDLIRRADSFEKTLMLGKTEGRRRERQRMRWLDGITDSIAMGLGTPGVGDGQGGLVCCGSWGRRELDTTEQLNWAELNWTELFTVVQVIKNNGSLGDYHRRHDRYRQCIILDGILEPKMNIR